MEIVKIKNGGELTLELTGRLDTTTAPSLENVISEEIDGVTALVLEFSQLDYISSAGLRVLLAAQKQMNKQGSMVIKNANDDIKEVFDITGFADILTLE